MKEDISLVFQLEGTLLGAAESVLEELKDLAIGSKKR